MPRYHRFAENDGRVKALTAALDDIRARYDFIAAAAADATIKPDLTPAIVQQVRAEAKIRNMKPRDLIKAIVEAVIEDNLFAALLDG